MLMQAPKSETTTLKGMSVNRLILILVPFLFFSCVNAVETESNNKKDNSKLVKKTVKKSLKSILNNYASKHKCKPVKKGEYSPYLIKGLFDDHDKPKSAMFYCKKKSSMGILIYLDSKIKTPIANCPRYISDVPENENMGLVFRSNNVFSGLNEGGFYYRCIKGKWVEGSSH